jgi:3-deoxy-D-manno-octulosonic-acid transferase
MTVLLFVYLFIFRPLLYPVILILSLFFPPLRRRLVFENKNRSDPFCVSFFRGNETAHICFEVSSEGELEGAMPLVKECLSRGKSLEMIFCSSSVEHRCEKLARDWPDQVRIFRLPLVSYFPFCPKSDISQWITAPRLVLCRYDFFPELLWHGRRKAERFLLIEATLKNYGRAASFLYRCWTAFVMRSFDFIAMSTRQDRNDLMGYFDLSPEKSVVLPLRPFQILTRIEEAPRKLFALPFYPALENYLKAFPPQKRLVFGSFWAIEAPALFDEKIREAINERRLHVCLVPHDLSPENLHLIRQTFQQSGYPVYEIHPGLDRPAIVSLFSSMTDHPGILLFNWKGILCELYTLYGHAFVGGGFGRSIHSVMEPFFAGCRIYCGHKTHRSTEFDFVKENASDEIHVMETPVDFAKILSRTGESQVEKASRAALAIKLRPVYEEFLRTQTGFDA